MKPNIPPLTDEALAKHQKQIKAINDYWNSKHKEIDATKKAKPNGKRKP